jgi:hypothetical protein
MPLSACIDHAVFPRICELEIGKSFDEVSEADWHRYSLDAATPRLQNLEGLDRAMSSLIMNTKIVDGKSRVTWLLTDFYPVLEAADMQNVYDHELKRCVRYFLSALRPPGFKTYVEVQ